MFGFEAGVSGKEGTPTSSHFRLRMLEKGAAMHSPIHKTAPSKKQASFGLLNIIAISYPENPRCPHSKQCCSGDF